MTPPSAPRAVGTVFRFLMAALLLGTLATALRVREAPRVPGFAEGEAGAPGCRPASACGPQLIDDVPAAPRVDRAVACADAAYLCDGLALRTPPLRALRWNERRPPVRMVVPWPDNGYAEDAAQHQRGAVRGLRAWDGGPVRVLVEAKAAPPVALELRDPDARSAATPVVRQRPRLQTLRRPDGSTYRAPMEQDRPDVQVEWMVTPRTTELAEAYTTWGSDGIHGGYGTRITSLYLPMLREYPGSPLRPPEVEAAAAHAMGHLLGLPHSPSPADVMYPGNTARTPSPDDLRALAALYALPNGAVIEGP